MLCSKEQQRTMRSPVSGLIAIVCSRCCVTFVAVVISARNSLAQTSISTEQGIVLDLVCGVLTQRKTTKVHRE